MLPTDLSYPAGLPATGQWMLDPQGEVACWLGAQVAGRGLREPINVILHDRQSRTPDAATALLFASVRAAGYGPRGLHSSGYQGRIGARVYAQQPEAKDVAFSDGPWWRSNNHARIFGPGPHEDGFVWTTSLSREDFVLLAALHHPYRSFRQAREDFCDCMTARTPFKETRRVTLDNLLNTPALMTGDHDGLAVVLETSHD